MSTLVTVGFIGLGRMGRGMANNILRSGTPLMVFDVVAEAVDEFKSNGALAADNIAEVAAKCDVIFTSLPGPAEIKAVTRGDDGLLVNAKPGLTIFDLSTSSPALARELAAEFGELGAMWLDAPVSGGPAGAASGDLVVWVGGPREAFDAHLPVLDTFSAYPRHVGEVGAGSITKLAHNMTGYMILEALAESFSLATKAGVEPLALWEALKLGVIGKQSPLEGLVNQFLPGEYEKPAFALRLAHKDLMLATELAREYQVPMRMANLTLAEMTEAVIGGMGEQDSRAYLKLQLARAGVEIAVDPAELARAVEEANAATNKRRA